MVFAKAPVQKKIILPVTSKTIPTASNLYNYNSRLVDLLRKQYKTAAFRSFSIRFYPITLEGCWSITDEFATTPFHLVLFSAALVELAKSIPVHSLINCLSTSSSVCLITVPCRIISYAGSHLEVEDLFCGASSGSEPSLFFSNYFFSLGFNPKMTFSMTLLE